MPGRANLSIDNGKCKDGADQEELHLACLADECLSFTEVQWDRAPIYSPVAHLPYRFIRHRGHNYLTDSGEKIDKFLRFTSFLCLGFLAG